MYRSICLSIFLPIYLSTYIHLSIYLPIYIYLSIYLSIHPSIHPNRTTASIQKRLPIDLTEMFQVARSQESPPHPGRVDDPRAIGPRSGTLACPQPRLYDGLWALIMGPPRHGWLLAQLHMKLKRAHPVRCCPKELQGHASGCSSIARPRLRALALNKTSCVDTAIPVEEDAVTMLLVLNS